MAFNSAAVTTQLNDLTAGFDRAAESYDPFYPKLCTIRPSTKAEEKYAWLGSMPGMRKWIGERRFGQLTAADYTLDNILWESSLDIEKTNIEDDQLGLYADPLAALGEEAAQHPDELMVSTLQLGETELCFDGQAFFDTDHVWGDSGTQSNDLTASIAGSVPTVSEFKTILENAVSAMLGFKRDNGKFYTRPIVKALSDLVICVPLTWRQVANEAVKALIIENTTNVVVDTPEIVVIPGLASTKCYLFRTGQRLKPFVFQARRPLQRQMKGSDDNEFKDVKFMTDARYNLGYLAWWNAVLTTVS